MTWFRAAFAVMLVLFLLPSDGRDRMDLYVTAQRTVADIGGFCGRNPDICEKVSASFYRVLQKLKSATNSIEDMLRETGLGAPRDKEYSGYEDGQGSPTSSVAAPAPASLVQVSSDTLTAADRGAGWKGPHGR